MNDENCCVEYWYAAVTTRVVKQRGGCECGEGRSVPEAVEVNQTISGSIIISGPAISGCRTIIAVKSGGDDTIIHSLNSGGNACIGNIQVDNTGRVNLDSGLSFNTTKCSLSALINDAHIIPHDNGNGIVNHSDDYSVYLPRSSISGHRTSLSRHDSKRICVRSLNDAGNACIGNRHIADHILHSNSGIAVAQGCPLG